MAQHSNSDPPPRTGPAPAHTALPTEAATTYADLAKKLASLATLERELIADERELTADDAMPVVEGAAGVVLADEPEAVPMLPPAISEKPRGPRGGARPGSGAKPRGKRALTEAAYVTLSAAEKKALQVKARRGGLTVSAYIRKALGF